MIASKRLLFFTHRAHFFVSLAWFAALACTAWVSATLFWRLNAPATISAQTQTTLSAQEAAQRITGGTSRNAEQAQSLAQASQHTLIGVATGFAGNLPGFALIQTSDEKVHTLQLNDSLPDGARLVSLSAEAVELEYAGTRQTVPLAQNRPASIAPPIINPSAPSVAIQRNQTSPARLNAARND